MDTWSIYEYNLTPFFVGIDGLNTITCGLWLIGCDGNLLSNQLIHEGGLPYIWASNHGDEAGLETAIL